MVVKLACIALHSLQCRALGDCATRHTTLATAAAPLASGGGRHEPGHTLCGRCSLQARNQAC